MSSTIPVGLQDFSIVMNLLRQQNFFLFDVLPEDSLEEKLISLLQDNRQQPYSQRVNEQLGQLRKTVKAMDLKQVRVVVLGGGSGLSTIVGGDSSHADWPEHPFVGLKQLFPLLNSVVCITDDGGSTGELQKDLPLVALGDLRHVLLSSIRLENLRQRYNLDSVGAGRCAVALSALFNYRFQMQPESPEQMLSDAQVVLHDLPFNLYEELVELTTLLFENPRLRPTLRCPQCLGNLLLAAAIYRAAGVNAQRIDGAVQAATILGLRALASAIGAHPQSVFPCTNIPARLQMLYANGVLVTSETKSSKAKRGYPVDRVLVEFSRPGKLDTELEEMIRQADIILLAPGSLYTSIIPILQVPGLAAAIRRNQQALKVLVANLWVQKGETDAAYGAPNRKFHVSDLICAYHRNIPEGIKELCSHVIALDMSNISGSVLQHYGLEGKQPILLDREQVLAMGFVPVEARISSESMMREYGIIQHNPCALATVIQGLWALHSNALLSKSAMAEEKLPAANFTPARLLRLRSIPCRRYEKIVQRLRQLQYTNLVMEGATLRKQNMSQAQSATLVDQIAEILRSHPDIPVTHLDGLHGISLLDHAAWEQYQQWNKVFSFSFYAPQSQTIKIRSDQAGCIDHFEALLLIALGQSLLGNYALEKKMEDIYQNQERIGRLFRLQVRPEEELRSFLTLTEINRYLHLVRMHCGSDACTYTRVINPQEGFTPPGLLFGFFYAWYLDNRFAPNIEYKMGIMRHDTADLIPEQVRIFERRRATIRFFRAQVFKQEVPQFSEEKCFPQQG